MRKLLGTGLGLAVAAVGLIVFPPLVVGQATGPIGGPRRPPTSPSVGGPVRPPGQAPDTRGPVPGAPADLPQIETRARRPVAEAGEIPLFTSDANYVTVDISVVDNDGIFIPGIPQGNFEILEDGVPQKIVNFGMGEGETTVLLLIEFSNLYQQYWSESWYQTLQAAFGFVQTLRPEDYVAVASYDLRPMILADFTQNRRDIEKALRSMQIAGFSEAATITSSSA